MRAQPDLRRPGAPDEPGRLAAMARGFLGRCPACGSGRLFRRYLKVADACEACGRELHHHRADDFPPYIVMFIVGHVVVYGILQAETRFAVPLWVHLALWPALALALALALLQPVKGAVVGLQLALGMHGFDAAKVAAPGDEEDRGRVGLTGSQHHGTPERGGT